MLIWRWYHVDTSKAKFLRISMSFCTYFLDVFSMVEKSTLFPRTFFDVISLVEKSTLFPRTFFDAICLAEISTLFLLTFFDVVSMGKNSTSFLVSCKLIRGGVCNFKQLTFARLFSLSFSSKSPWVTQFHWNLSLTPLQKELLQVSFLGIYRTTTLPNNFWATELLWSYSCKKV